jgi:hypothetical protein
MRKLTAAQIAAMTASLGVLGNLATRYGIPMVGLAAIAHADVYTDDELDEVVFIVDGTEFPWIVRTYPHSGSGCSGTSCTPTKPYVAQAPTNAVGPVLKNAVRCAEHYSVDVAATEPTISPGSRPDFSTKFQTGAAWGTELPNLKPKFVITGDYVNPPADKRYTTPILGSTTFDDTTGHVSTIFTDMVRNHAQVQSNQTTYDQDLVNTITHEWSHEWWSPETEADANRIGKKAGDAYRAGGGANAPCNTAPIHNGRVGGGGNK